MKVSGFTFLRNGQKLGYPFAASIRSILPIVDEFVIALGPCDDDTEKLLREIGDPKIRVIPTQWNENIRPDYSVKGFVYGQQKTIALFNCAGDWAFYLEADEVVHENDLSKIRGAMEKHLDDERVEALAFDYLHFYGNQNTLAWSPGWYRSEVRIIRNTIPAWSSEALFFNVVVSHKKSRYPRAAHSGATIYHYGWVRSEAQMNLKTSEIYKHWVEKPVPPTDYSKIDAATLELFTGTHPKVVQDWLPEAKGIFQTDPNHKLTSREKKHRRLLWLEKTFGLRFNKKHYRLIR
ncbi:MAG: glycosyltransferase [Verrucomicrobiota bacterium]|nr:glycosyltransferase [Verrucomicrobiota bacterium]MDE3067834.1 glycosyltransferase [Verrucomicrobiota bacterium]